MIIIHKDIALREWIPSKDISQLEGMVHDEIAAPLGPHFPFDRKKNQFDPKRALVYMTNTCVKKNYLLLKEDVPVGGVGFKKDEDNLWYVHYWVARQFKKQQIATNGLKLATVHAFDNLSFPEIHATVYVWNDPSIRVLEKCGYNKRKLLKGKVSNPTMDTELHYSLTREEFNKIIEYKRLILESTSIIKY